MDHDLFVSLIHNLLNMDVICCEEDGAGFQHFDEKYCYNAALQPMFTAAALGKLTASAQDHVIYELQDWVGIWVQFFRQDKRIYIVGPYVRQVFDPDRFQRTLLAVHMPTSYMPSLKLYYSGFPLLSSTTVRNTIVACLQSLTGTVQEYGVCRVDNRREEARLPSRENYTENLDYNTVYRRYDLENRFLRLIETGDTENVLMAYRGMDWEGTEKHRYASAVYLNPSISLSMVRALARKAAERGGASVIEVNEITQRAVQRMVSAKNTGEQSQCTLDMIYELTQAVQRSRMRMGHYSMPVRKAVEYLTLNYSQKIHLSTLARLVNLSASHFSKRFKDEVGMTVFQYIAHLRCVQAAEMLRGSDWSVQEISGFVGYPDNNYFVKVFKKEYGMTPSEYRAT